MRASYPVWPTRGPRPRRFPPRGVSCRPIRGTADVARRGGDQDEWSVTRSLKSILLSVANPSAPPPRLTRCERRALLGGLLARSTPGFRQPNILGVSRTAGPACRSRSGAAVDAEELHGDDWRTATAVTSSPWR